MAHLMQLIIVCVGATGKCCVMFNLFKWWQDKTNTPTHNDVVVLIKDINELPLCMLT